MGNAQSCQSLRNSNMDLSQIIFDLGKKITPTKIKKQKNNNQQVNQHLNYNKKNLTIIEQKPEIQSSCSDTESKHQILTTGCDCGQSQEQRKFQQLSVEQAHFKKYKYQSNPQKYSPHDIKSIQQSINPQKLHQQGKNEQELQIPNPEPSVPLHQRYKIQNSPIEIYIRETQSQHHNEPTENRIAQYQYEDLMKKKKRTSMDFKKKQSSMIYAPSQLGRFKYTNDQSNKKSNQISNKPYMIINVNQ